MVKSTAYYTIRIIKMVTETMNQAGTACIQGAVLAWLIHSVTPHLTDMLHESCNPETKIHRCCITKVMKTNWKQKKTFKRTKMLERDDVNNGGI